jgi:lysophospholipase L1-like esterase
MNFKRLMTVLGAIFLVGIIALSWGCQNSPTGPEFEFEEEVSGKIRSSSWWGGGWSTTTSGGYTTTTVATTTTTSGGYSTTSSATTTTAGSWWGGGSWYSGSSTTTSSGGWYVGTSTTTTTSGGYTTTSTSGGGGWYGDIIVRARGTGGGEHIYVTVGGSQVADFNLTTSYQDYSASTSNTGEITVCFDNDDGENMDVQIDYIEVDGERRQAEDQQSNTGVWQNSSCGGEYSEMLHCEGCINFGSVSGGSSATTTSGGYTTTTSGGYTTSTAATTTTTSGWGGGWWSSTTTTSGGYTTTTSGGGTQIDGNQVLIIGNSFIANSHDITGDLEQMARDAGILAYGDNFIDNSLNSAQLSGGPVTTIPQQYANGNSQRRIRWVIMSGGGNDCVRSGCNPATTSCSNLQNAVNALRGLLSDMGSDGVLKVIYFFYPDPQLDEPEQTQLKGQLDVLRPMIQDVVNSSSAPVCYWLDLRPVFQGHYSEYVLSDGLHPSAAGSQATAEAIWNIVEQNNFFSGN